MPNKNSPVGAVDSKVDSKTNEPVTPGYKEVLYSPARVSRWLNGEMTLQELHAVSGPEMLALSGIGYAMFKEGKYAEARVIFEGLSALNPKEVYYLTALGAIHLVQENLEMSERCLSAAISVSDQEVAAFVNRGEVYLRQGKLLEAARDFKRAVELDPENKDPITTRARILATAALEMMEAAEKQAQNQSGAATSGAKKK